MKKLTYIFMALMLFSCSKEDFIPNSAPGALRQMTTGGLAGTNTYKYAYDAGKLQFVVNQNGYEEITYSGDLITKIDQFDNNSDLVARRVFQYEITNRLVSALSLDYVSGTGSKQELTYNADQTVEVNTYTGDLVSQGTLTRTDVHYFTGGEISKTVINPGVNETVVDYLYDDKSTPFKTILGLDKLNLVDLNLASLSPHDIKGIAHNRLGSIYSLNGTIMNEVHYDGTYLTNGFAAALTPDYTDSTVTDLTHYTFSYY